MKSPWKQLPNGTSLTFWRFLPTKLWIDKVCMTFCGADFSHNKIKLFSAMKYYFNIACQIHQTIVAAFFIGNLGHKFYLPWFCSEGPQECVPKPFYRLKRSLKFDIHATTCQNWYPIRSGKWPRLLTSNGHNFLHKDGWDLVSKPLKRSWFQLQNGSEMEF